VGESWVARVGTTLPKFAPFAVAGGIEDRALRSSPYAEGAVQEPSLLDDVLESRKETEVSMPQTKKLVYNAIFVPKSFWARFFIP
jgi:hypothetical protein